MTAKFKIGDRVRFAPRVCRWATEDMRRRTRRVVDIAYDPEKRCTFYQLGGRGGLNQWAENGYWFRSYELYAVNDNGQKIGRPSRRELRQNKLKVLSASPNRQHRRLTPNQAQLIKQNPNRQLSGIATPCNQKNGVSSNNDC